MTAEVLQAIQSHPFVSVEFRNGHEHTVAAYGHVCGSPYDGEHEGQIYYIEYVCQNERTDVYDILVASTETEAIELGIIEEDGSAL
jgi:hypothetical protein